MPFYTLDDLRNENDPLIHSAQAAPGQGQAQDRNPFAGMGQRLDELARPIRQRPKRVMVVEEARMTHEEPEHAVPVATIAVTAVAVATMTSKTAKTLSYCSGTTMRMTCIMT
ncbi:hypothetical protein LTR10_015418 [Elasticomyces elasticus]|nr:hypothetical protein LTR10_015418 [Elasticomyces elasticus]